MRAEPMFTWQPSPTKIEKRFGDLICIAAKRSADALIEQFESWPAMDVAEFRGYVRARVAAGVRRQIGLVMGDDDATESLPHEVVQLARERAVHLVVREHLLRSQVPVVRKAA